MIKKILIANRGEIAVRVIRACAELGITSVAVFSEPDRYALHVKKADEAYCMGSDPLSHYLNPHSVVKLALETHCDAIHPGYGFLSENAEFAEICELNHIAFIGPSASVIRSMGDKTQARNTLIQAGIPVTPGSDGNIHSLEEAESTAKHLGFPVMLKATSGGGGRGIRRCNSLSELRKNFERVLSEATQAFGNAEIFMEKCIINPKHIEVQVIADKHGNIVHLYERDCSIQRRHQKLIEIAPSPQISDELREHLGSLAVKVAKAVNYVNAGTVEFLVSESGECFFMEMNTRVQVEHTITEQITGIDIVTEQIQIANFQKLSVSQSDIQIRGFSAQFRINAEDPKNNFLPSFGQISRYYAPGGPGVRIDTAIYTGYSIPPFYDSLCAKVIVWSNQWEQLIARSKRALNDVKISGIKTTLPYLLAILDAEAFAKGQFNTAFVETHPELVHYSEKRIPQELATVIAAAIVAHSGL